MNRKPFVHLHVHTTYSLLDGISRREDLIAKAKEFGQPALAITEHGNLFNAISFYKSATDAGIVPIIGMEAYVAPDTRFGREYAKKGEAEEDAKNGDLSMSAYHLTILSKNRQGYENLKKLSTLAYREGFYRKPRIDDELLAANKEGLIILSGCLASKVSRFIVAGNKEKALEQVDKMRGIFGEDFFLEVMNHSIPEEVVVREALLDFGKTHGIPVVMTGDSHYTEHGDTDAHEAALAMGTGKTLSDPNRWRFQGEGYWFKSTEEMYESAASGDIPEHALTAAYDISKRIDDYGFKLVSKTKQSIIPLFRNEQGDPYENEDCHQLLAMKAYQGLVERGLGDSKVHQDRLAEELDMIKRKDFSSYFLIISDIIENAMRKKGILPPIGRGSSMGSLVCYCLYIIGLDPIKMKIPFSRFINEGRKDLPDIDTDISKERRKEVVQYIIDKYGKDRVAQIVTFQTLAVKGAADNVGRVLGVPSSVRRALGKVLGDLTKEDTLEATLEANKAARETMQQTPGWIEICAKLEGNNKNLGEHAAGIVISNDPIENHVPLIRDTKEGHLVTQYDMKDLGELGLLKLDMLGLKTLDLIQQSIELIEKRRGIKIDFQSVPLDDKATYATVASAKFVSVFQLDGGGIRSVAKQLHPDRFEHLVALNALYRPGPMLPGSGDHGKSMLENYIERRHGREQVTIWHKDLAQVFDDTFGIALFQEQIMELSKILGKFNDEEADGYRAAIGKKDKVKFEAVQKKLVERGIANGYSKEFMEETARRLAGSARYNWNRGHSAGYSYITYVTAYLETHFPTEYFTTLLNVNLDDTDNLKTLLSAVLQKGVKLRTPHINNSHSFFHTDGKDIYMGLYSIRGLGEAAVPPILEERTQNGPFKDYLDFCIRVSKFSKITKLTKENLVKAGAFDWDMSMLKKDMIQNTELIQDIIKKFKDKLNSAEELRKIIESKLVHSQKDYTDVERLEYEKGVLNFYISSHPVMQFQPLFGLFDNINFITPSQINEQQAGTKAIVVGLVENRTMKTTRNGDPYVMLRVCDQVSTSIMNVWNPLCHKANNVLVDNQLAMLSGTIREDKFRPGDMQLSVQSVAPLGSHSGIPISGFYAPDMVTVNRILTCLGATASAVSDAILHAGHVVILKNTAYICPQHYEMLSGCKRVSYQLVL